MPKTTRIFRDGNFEVTVEAPHGHLTARALYELFVRLEKRMLPAVAEEERAFPRLFIPESRGGND
jgi:hypothetical protein